LAPRALRAQPSIGSFWLITEGIKPGEKVVYEGLQKVKDGITVNPAIADINPIDQDEK